VENQVYKFFCCQNVAAGANPVAFFISKRQKGSQRKTSGSLDFTAFIYNQILITR